MKRIAPRSRTKKPPPGRDDGLRAFVRGLPCLLWFRQSYSPCGCAPDRNWTEPAHVKPWGSSRIDADNLIPLCPRHHDEQEGRTEAFQSKYGIDLTAEAQAVTRRYRGEG